MYDFADGLFEEILLSISAYLAKAAVRVLLRMLVNIIYGCMATFMSFFNMGEAMDESEVLVTLQKAMTVLERRLISNKSERTWLQEAVLSADKGANDELISYLKMILAEVSHK